MARQSRGDLPGSWHHVINRGLAKRALFEDRDDARFFLARLARQIRLGRIEVHAYCLMTTHFHFLVRSPLGRLSEAMRRVQNEHSRRFNRRRKRDGALVRGRYFSRCVRSEEYRRTLVRYIDANPIKAKLVPSLGDYELSSAAAYLRDSGPPWLHRAWVEAEACRMVGELSFGPQVYRAAFGARDAHELSEISDFVETRTAQSTAVDPLDDLVGAAPERVRAWMQRKAKLADGHRVGLPVCGQRALRRALDEHLVQHGAWMIEDGRKTWRGRELAWHGLLRDLCGYSWQLIADLSDGSLSRARRLGIAHRRFIAADAGYARRVAQVGHAAIAQCLGR